MLILSADMFIALDKDANGTLSKQELREYADGTLTEIFIERGNTAFHLFLESVQLLMADSCVCRSSDETADFFISPICHLLHTIFIWEVSF